MKTKFTSWIFPLLLTAVGAILVLTNYTPGTILSGWDTLHPEFNLPLYLQRIFWGVWQQHQGLGAVAAQAHASELGRLWYLWIPFRYGYFWLMLIIGPLGVYKLLGGKIKGFLGGLFYLLNLGTMQHFYLPLEMFATGYAFLPWLFWAVYEKRLVLLSFLFLISAPMAHTPTLWLINFSALVIFAFCLDKKWSVKVFLTGIFVNSFWLLPNLYFIFNHAADVANSHISRQFSPKAIAVSREFGNLWDIALIRGYLFDWGHFDFVSRQFVDFFPVWKNHLSNPFVLTIGYGSFAAVIFGVFVSLKKKIPMGKAMIPVLIFSVLGLLAFIDTEALRFPFTKFSLLLMLAFSVYFGMAVDYLKKFWIVIPVLLIIYMWPAFNGNLICDCERVKFPAEYQETFDWFNKQDPDTRIAPFPVDSIYGWGYYDWGYEGAGFRWFGLPQPILDREFDRWMPTNENYYKEISYALYSKNLPLFESVLEKYRVDWLLVDGNIINPSSPKALYLDELKDLVKKSDKIREVREVRKIGIYKFNLKTPTKSFVSVATNLLAPVKKEEIDPKKIVDDSIEVKPPYFLPDISHNQGYLITVTGKSSFKRRRGALFWLENLNSRRADIEERLKDGVNYFVQPPMEPDGLGYSLHFENFEVEKVTLGVVEKEILEPPRMTMGQYDNNFLVEHPNPAFYRVDVNTAKPATLILAQSFDKGWLALGAKNHILIDNWANGWTIDPGLRIVYLFYWPQLLEFAGFALLTIFIIGLIIKERTSSASK